MKTLRCFSMFSGIGGGELGIEQAAAAHGVPVEWIGYSEIEKNAIKVYERHWPEHVNYGDAALIDPDGLAGFDLLIAGFPCQPFSVAGQRRGFADTRGTLFFDIARILERKRPRHFILENVKGLLSHDGGRTFRVIIEALDELGYLVEWQVLNSKNHGVPQSRERVYIVGHLGGRAGRTVFPFAGQGNPYTTVGESTETTVARTLTAGGHSAGNHSGMTIIRCPEGDRRLTRIECERLQGFPDNHTEVSSDSQSFKQTGNAMTVNVVEAVAYRLLEGWE